MTRRRRDAVPEDRAPFNPRAFYPNLDNEGIVDFHLGCFTLMGTVFELRFHPRPDKGSPLSVLTTDAAPKRYYLRVNEQRKLLEAVHGDDEMAQTPFDDIAFRLVHLGEVWPRFVVEAERTKWCTCPRVRGLHPNYFCLRIVVPNWASYWSWRDEMAKKLLETEQVDRIAPNAEPDPTLEGSLEQAKASYPHLGPVMRHGNFSMARGEHPDAE